MTEIATVVQAHDSLGECCLWCPRTRRLWWLDINKPCLQSFDPATREHKVYPVPGRNCGCAGLRASGGFVLAIGCGLHGFDPTTGSLQPLVAVEPDLPDNRFNDGRCDRRGRLWIGTMDNALRRASGSFYRIGGDRSALCQFDGITVPNSTAFSPDNRTLYFSDTFQHAIWAFDFDIDSGTISNRRVFVDLTARKGTPDGSCIDAEGYLWNAEYGHRHLVRYAPDGRVDRTIELPVTNPTCCCFGGDGLDTLYVTSAAQQLSAAAPVEGALLAINVGVRGLPEAMFAG